ncbi:MAG TPA: hypothetical protein GXZ98_06295 [Firmicutes bacterium]|nr:hypothetical protein [Bacillota bacterium]
MKKKSVTTSFLLVLLLLVLVTPMATAEERLPVVQIETAPNGVFTTEAWAQTTSPYLYSFPGNLAINLYAASDGKKLYLGFQVEDSFLSFTDDFSLNFKGSDHLRLYFFPEGQQQPPVTLYLLPNSKIKEPLLNIEGASWRQTSVTVRSLPTTEGYFLTVTIDLANLKTAPRQREIPLQIMVNEINKEGKTKTYWLFGMGLQDYGTLVLAR